jgi:hypothetical protein
MDVNFDTLNEQLTKYGTKTESDPQWLKEHNYVNAYHIIQDQVELGLYIFESLVRRGLRNTITVFEGRTVCELYEKWLEDSRHWVACAMASERKGHKVSGADELKENVWAIHSWLPELRSLSEELTAVIEGRGVPFEKSLNGV